MKTKTLGWRQLTEIKEDLITEILETLQEDIPEKYTSIEVDSYGTITINKDIEITEDNFNFDGGLNGFYDYIGRLSMLDVLIEYTKQTCR